MNFVLSEHYEEKLDQITNQNWDILFLGYCNYCQAERKFCNDFYREQIVDDIYEYGEQTPSNNLYCAHAYAVSRKFAEFFVRWNSGVKRNYFSSLK